MNKIYVLMRKDLAFEGTTIPSWELDESDSVYLSADDLRGAFTVDCKNPNENYELVQLKDGRKLYVLSIDLDYYPEHTITDEDKEFLLELIESYGLFCGMYKEALSKHDTNYKVFNKMEG